MRLIMTAVAALVLAACGPSEDEFRGACLSRCMHETGACGRTVGGEADCGDFCDAEWADALGQSTDCQWYMIYWADCRAEAPCDDLDLACLSEALDIAGTCVQ